MVGMKNIEAALPQKEYQTEQLAKTSKRQELSPFAKLSNWNASFLQHSQQGPFAPQASNSNIAASGGLTKCSLHCLFFRSANVQAFDQVQDPQRTSRILRGLCANTDRFVQLCHREYRQVQATSAATLLLKFKSEASSLSEECRPLQRSGLSM